MRTYFRLLPATGIPGTSFFFLAGPGHLHESAVQALSRSPLGRANTFSLLFLPSTPLISVKLFPDSILFRSASLSLLCILSSTSPLQFPNFPADIAPSWFPPISFRTFSTTLSHLIPARPFVTFSHTALSTTRYG